MGAQACFGLHTLKFITEGANALIIGKPDTCKSHVAKAVAYQATLQGYSVKYDEDDSDFAKFGLATPVAQAKILRIYIHVGAKPDPKNPQNGNFRDKSSLCCSANR